MLFSYAGLGEFWVGNGLFGFMMHCCGLLAVGAWPISRSLGLAAHGKLWKWLVSFVLGCQLGGAAVASVVHTGVSSGSVEMLNALYCVHLLLKAMFASFRHCCLCSSSASVF